MTYNVFGKTLNFALSIYLSIYLSIHKQAISCRWSTNISCISRLA